MSHANPACPGCGAVMQNATAGYTGWVCTCGGRIVGLAPFEKELHEGVGARIWVASEGGTPGTACPICHLPMHAPSSDPAAPADLLVCRLCHEIWIPPTAADWMKENSAGGAPGTGGPVAVTVPTECPNCGAPYEVDPKGRCRFCRSQLAAPTPAVVTIEMPIDPLPTSLLGLSRMASAEPRTSGWF